MYWRRICVDGRNPALGCDSEDMEVQAGSRTSGRDAAPRHAETEVRNENDSGKEIEPSDLTKRELIGVYELKIVDGDLSK